MAFLLSGRKLGSWPGGQRNLYKYCADVRRTMASKRALKRLAADGRPLSSVDGPETKKGAEAPFFKDLQTSVEVCRSQYGAGKESRTLDLNLGKVALYQLSYSRILLIFTFQKISTRIKLYTTFFVAQKTF
jgi:hypothetical protein